MGLQTISGADNKLNSFWRAFVLSADPPRPTDEIIELSINSKLELTGTVESLVKSVSAKMGFDEDDAGWIELAAREAVVNAIKHGNHYLADTHVDVQFLIGQDALTIFVRDHGEGFDPTNLPDPLDQENLLNPTGRGILWMRKFMDEVEYSSHPDGGCVVRMKKYKRSSKKQINGSLGEVEGKSWIEQRTTVDLRLCRACSAEMRDHDMFCRHCGARQTGAIAPTPLNTRSTAYATSRLQDDAFNSVSASVLNAIAAGAQAGTAQLKSRRLRRAVSALIAVPLWLMIVLLSPLDAYTTAKAIAGQHTKPPHRNFGSNSAN